MLGISLFNEKDENLISRLEYLLKQTAPTPNEVLETNATFQVLQKRRLDETTKLLQVLTESISVLDRSIIDFKETSARDSGKVFWQGSMAIGISLLALAISVYFGFINNNSDKVWQNTELKELRQLNINLSNHAIKKEYL